jgi:hypothetical protein
MNDPRWTTVDGLFEAALERDPTERAAFLRERCPGGSRHRRRVDGQHGPLPRAFDLHDKVSPSCAP